MFVRVASFLHHFHLWWQQMARADDWYPTWCPCPYLVKNSSPTTAWLYSSLIIICILHALDMPFAGDGWEIQIQHTDTLGYLWIKLFIDSYMHFLFLGSKNNKNILQSRVLIFSLIFDQPTQSRKIENKTRRQWMDCTIKSHDILWHPINDQHTNAS